MSNAPNAITDSFYVVAREPGAEHPARNGIEALDDLGVAGFRRRDERVLERAVAARETGLPARRARSANA